MHKKFFFEKNFLTPKTSKNVIFGLKMVKNGKVKKFWSKYLFWLESIQNVLIRNLKRKYQSRIFFPRLNFCLGQSFLLRAPDSINGNGYAAGAGRSFDEQASTGKAT